MKKGIAVAAALVFAGASVFAQGLNVSGFVRAGVTVPTDSDLALSTDKWMGCGNNSGGYFGGASRVRLNVDYTGENGGITFRYQKSGSFATSDAADFFAEDDISYLMGYATFLDGKVIAEAGKLVDLYTSTGGWEDGTFGDNAGAGTGARLVASPVEGLYLAASVSDYGLGDTLTFGKEAFGFSAKYTMADTFFVAGGYHLAEEAYASFGLLAVENLALTVESFFWLGDSTTTMLVPWVEYSGISNVVLGAVAYITIAEDATNMVITPAASYAFTDWLTASVEADINIPDEGDGYAVITPAVSFGGGDLPAVATVFASISTDTDMEANAIGCGVKYSF